jgi:hypothetical protein
MGIDPVTLFDEENPPTLGYSPLYHGSASAPWRTRNGWTTDNTIRFFEEATMDRSHFLYTSYFGPHQPYDPPAPYDTLYDRHAIELPPTFLRREESPRL